MSFLIIKVSDENASKILHHWKQGARRKEIADYFIRDLGSGTYLTEPTGEMLALAWSLKERYENKVDVFVAELLTENEVPKIIKEVSRCLTEKPKSVEILRKVKDIRMKCYVSSNETSLDSFVNLGTE
jgi:hypothetical protein